MDLSIEQNCPSCGASIILSETDRLIKCGFCDVNNYMVGSVAGRFVLPAAVSDVSDGKKIFYAPYLRFKGSIFYVKGIEVKHKIVDTTRAGIKSRIFPVSLGVRPQAMNIKPVVAGTEGSFIQQTVKTKTLFVHAARIPEIFNVKKNATVYFRAFIGETLSRIYQPYYLKDGDLFDAIDNRFIGNGQNLRDMLTRTCLSKISWEPQFISTHCPECGGLLDGERDSFVLHCRNCQSLWREENKKFVPVPWTVVGSENSSVLNMPVWRLSLSTTGCLLKTYGDFLRFTNQPVIVRKEYDSRPLTFLIPAFKINPKTLLKVASQLTVAQPRIPDGKIRRLINHHPVTLQCKEAVQFIKGVLAATTLNRKKRFPLLPGIHMEKPRCELVYLPFNIQSHDFVQQHTHVVINKAAIRYGRTL